MVYRVHGDTAYMRPLAHIPGPSGFTDDHVLVFHIANLANGSPAALQYHPKLTGREPNRGIFPFFSHELGGAACGTDHLPALARLQFDVVDHSAHGNVLQGQSVARLDVSVRPRLYHIAYVQAHRG